MTRRMARYMQFLSIALANMTHKALGLQIEDNLASLKFVDKLTPEILKKVDDLFGNKPEGVKKYFSYN